MRTAETAPDAAVELPSLVSRPEKGRKLPKPHHDTAIELPSLASWKIKMETYRSWEE